MGIPSIMSSSGSSQRCSAGFIHHHPPAITPCHPNCTLWLRPSTSSPTMAVLSKRSPVLVRAAGKFKGFGSPPSKQKPKKVTEEVEPSFLSGLSRKDDDRGNADVEEDGDDVIPEVVTERMLKRIGFTVGIPLVVGITFFPLYYYLKVVKKVEIPDWLPFITSVGTFGFAGLGISYGVISSSWDPNREGTFWGWKEAQVNWPTFMNSVQGKK